MLLLWAVDLRCAASAWFFLFPAALVDLAVIATVVAAHAADWQIPSCWFFTQMGPAIRPATVSLLPDTHDTREHPVGELPVALGDHYQRNHAGNLQ